MTTLSSLFDAALISNEAYGTTWSGVENKAPSKSVVYDEMETKAVTSHLHDGRYYTESEVDTLSGTLNEAIPNYDFGIYTLSSGISEATIVFGSNQIDTNYVLTATLQTIDNPPSIYGLSIGVTTVSGFTTYFSSVMDSANYKLNWQLIR